MKLKNKILLCLLGVVLFVPSLFADSDGFFYTLNPDPYSQSLGASILSLSPSVLGFFTNPASNYKNISKELQVSYMSYYDRNYGINAGFLIPTEKKGNFSFIASYMDFNGDLFYKNALMAAINYVYPIVSKYPIYTEKGSVGATFKFYNISFTDNDENKSLNLYSFDLGFIYSLDFIDDDLMGALAIKNIGNDFNYETYTQKQEQNFTASARYLVSYLYKVSLVADMVKNFQITDMGYACGVETKPFYPFSLRVGWRDYRDGLNKGITAGFCLDFDRVNISYSYSDLMNTDDDQHIFSLGIYIGKIPDSGKAYDHYLGYYLNKAKSSYARKDYISARKEFEEILSVYPDSTVAKHYLSLLSEDLDQSDRDMSGKIEKYIARADAALLRNNLVRAKKYYNKVLELDDTNYQAIEGLEKVEKEVREQEIFANRKKYQKEISEHWVKAMNYYNNGEFVFAKDELLKITEIDPENAGALQYLGFIQKKIDKVNAVQANNIFKQGLAEYERQDYEKALSYFNAAYISSPSRDDIKEYIDMCNEQLNIAKNKTLNDSDDVVPETSLKNKKSSEKTLTNKQIESQMKKIYNTGLEQYTLKNYKAALKTFEKLKVLANKNNYYNYNEQIKNYTTKSKQAISKQLYNEGKEFEMKEELSKAYAKYKGAIKYDAKNSLAKKELERLNSVISQRYYEQGLQAFSLKDNNKAKTMLKKALEYDPKKSEAKKLLERIENN